MLGARPSGRGAAHFPDGTTLTGYAMGLNDDASLILRTQDGTDHTVRTADVGVL